MDERKRKEKERFEQRKEQPEGLPLKFYPIPRKFPTELHKTMQKLEKQYDKFSKCPLRLARILKRAESVGKRIQKLERSTTFNN